MATIFKFFNKAFKIAHLFYLKCARLVCLPRMFKLELEVSVAFSLQVFFQLPISAPDAENQFGDYNDNGFFFLRLSLQDTQNYLYRRHEFSIKSNRLIQEGGVMFRCRCFHGDIPPNTRDNYLWMGQWALPLDRQITI